MRRIILVTGGQRSGKSRYAESLALSLSRRPVYVATAHVWDEEFRRRVAAHQARRGPEWQTVEEERWLGRLDLSGRVAVIDCLTLWATNFFCAPGEGGRAGVGEALEAIQAEFDRLTSRDATFIFVTNEIGMGGVSQSEAQRLFTDLQGRLNQYVAEKADEVVLMVSGVAVRIKGER